MTAEEINALGGWCELVGVWFVARDLMSLAHYREKPKEWAARLQERAAQFRAWWGSTRLMAWWRRLLGRQQPGTVAGAGTANVTLTGLGVTQSSGTGTLTLGYDQSLQDQVEELRQRVNQLEKDISDEKLQREQAIDAERQARRKEIQAESDERERRIAEVRREVEGLRDATTGDLGLKAEGVVFLVVGIAFTVWPEMFADWLPGWPPFRVAVFFVVAYPVARFSWRKWLRPPEE